MTTAVYIAPTSTTTANGNNYYYSSSPSNSTAFSGYHVRAQPQQQQHNAHYSGNSLAGVPPVPSPQLSISPPRSGISKRFGGLSALAAAGTSGIQQPSPLPFIHSLSVTETFRKVLSDVDIDECEPAGENAFMVCDIKRVWDKYLLWQKEIGDRVEAFFAVKCNPDPVILQMMARLGLGFDCASHNEISTVLSYGVDPNKIIYANPCKAGSFIRHAAKQNVQMMTFDNSDELVKIKKFHPRAKMVLRILTDDSGSLCKLGLKFGAPLGEVRGLLKKAKELDVDVIGISFHVGSGCTNPELFGDAVSRAKWAFGVGKELGFDFTLLDVGGGFGGDNFVEIAGILRVAIEKEFPREQGVRIIAEPGRYFVSEAFEMATNIIARRGKSGAATQDEEDEHISVDDTLMLGDEVDGAMEGDALALNSDEGEAPIVMYYINDGVYGAFNCIMFDHQVCYPRVLTLSGNFIPSHDIDRATNPDEYEDCSVWGPTCDSIDCVTSKAQLPNARIRVGDWLRWENMGAYTICAASQFNGFKQSKVIYTIDAEPYDEAQIRRYLQ